MSAVQVPLGDLDLHDVNELVEALERDRDTHPETWNLRLAYILGIFELSALNAVKRAEKLDQVDAFLLAVAEAQDMVVNDPELMDDQDRALQALDEADA